MVDDIEFTMVSDAANVWSVNGSFKVGGQIYKVIAADGGCKIEGEDSTGNSLSTTTTNLQLLDLLARLIGKENDTDSTLVISHLNKIPTYNAFCSLLTALGSLNGRVVSTRTSELPHEHGDRSLLVVTSEQESPRISGVNTKFFLNWELLHRNTETTATLNEIRNGGPDYSGLHVRYIERKGTAVPIEDYLLSQQIPELFSIDSQSDIPTLIDPHDNQAAWIYATTTFMTTIGPLLEPYRHLDQPPEEIITEERP